MICGILRRISIPLGLLVVVSLAAPPQAGAQGGGPVGPSVFNPPAPPKMNARTEEPLDLTGYWVSVVTEDWRYRMITPDKNDFPGVPLNTEGRRIANEWDPAKDEASGNQCKAYGAAAIMRVPTRLHITWVDDSLLKVETDAGTQTREFHFDATPPANATPSWQGFSVASWQGLRPRGFVLPVVAGSGGARPGQEGYLKVITTDLRPGYLRKNGLPYGTKATVEEYFDSFTEAGVTWLIVTTVVTDPQFMDSSFITSSQFKKQADATGWNPTPCAAK